MSTKRAQHQQRAQQRSNNQSSAKNGRHTSSNPLYTGLRTSRPFFRYVFLFSLFRKASNCRKTCNSKRECYHMMDEKEIRHMQVYQTAETRKHFSRRLSYLLVVAVIAEKKREKRQAAKAAFHEGCERNFLRVFKKGVDSRNRVSVLFRRDLQQE